MSISSLPFICPARKTPGRPRTGSASQAEATVHRDDRAFRRGLLARRNEITARSPPGYEPTGRRHLHVPLAKLVTGGGGSWLSPRPGTHRAFTVMFLLPTSRASGLGEPDQPGLRRGVGGLADVPRSAATEATFDDPAPPGPSIPARARRAQMNAPLDWCRVASHMSVRTAPQGRPGVTRLLTSTRTAPRPPRSGERLVHGALVLRPSQCHGRSLRARLGHTSSLPQVGPYADGDRAAPLASTSAVGRPTRATPRPPGPPSAGGPVSFGFRTDSGMGWGGPRAASDTAADGPCRRRNGPPQHVRPHVTRPRTRSVEHQVARLEPTRPPGPVHTMGWTPRRCCRPRRCR